MLGILVLVLLAAAMGVVTNTIFNALINKFSPTYKQGTISLIVYFIVIVGLVFLSIFGGAGNA